MSGRQLGWIFGVLVLMLAAWLLLRSRSGQRASEGLDLASRVGADVSYIHIQRPGDSAIELERRTDGWTVNGYPAVDSLVAATVEGLDTLGIGRLIARSAASHERLDLTPDAAVHVRVGPPNRPDAEFLVGGTGRGGRFVRLPAEDAAYVLPDTILAPLVRGERAWRDFTIARVDTASLQRVVIRRADAPDIELSRTAEPDGEAVAARDGAADDRPAAPAWTVDGFPADTAVMRVYLETLARLRATGFPADSFVYAADFENPLAILDLYQGEGAPAGPERIPDVSLLFATGLDHPDVMVRRADDPIVYALDRPRANLLTTRAERLRAR